MTFPIGTKIIFQGYDNQTRALMIKAGIITKTSKDLAWIDNAHKMEDCIYAAFLYPDTEESRAFLTEGIELTLRHKKEEDEYMKKTYQFNNELIRKGMK